LITKLSFYFESAKKTGEKFRENLDSRILKDKSLSLQPTRSRTLK
jgi:hypothetical protein